MSEVLQPGFHGKVPGLGDFVTRRLARSFLDHWDLWLQSSIAKSKEQYGDRWYDLYLTSPIWRFALSANICGTEAWVGIMIPSVDRVGRHFPLCIISPIPVSSNLFQIISTQKLWFDAAEDVILSALDEQVFNLNEFDRKVAELGCIIYDPLVQIVAENPVRNDSALHIGMDDFRAFPDACNYMVHNQLMKSGKPYSLWWSDGSDNIGSSLLVCEGLPAAENYSAMLDGQWQHWNWEDRLVMKPLIRSDFMQPDEDTSKDAAVVAEPIVPVPQSEPVAAPEPVATMPDVNPMDKMMSAGTVNHDAGADNPFGIVDAFGGATGEVPVVTPEPSAAWSEPVAAPQNSDSVAPATADNPYGIVDATTAPVVETPVSDSNIDDTRTGSEETLLAEVEQAGEVVSTEDEAVTDKEDITAPYHKVEVVSASNPVVVSDIENIVEQPTEQECASESESEIEDVTEVEPEIEGTTEEEVEVEMSDANEVKADIIEDIEVAEQSIIGDDFDDEVAEFKPQVVSDEKFIIGDDFDADIAPLIDESEAGTILEDNKKKDESMSQMEADKPQAGNDE